MSLCSTSCKIKKGATIIRHFNDNQQNDEFTKKKLDNIKENLLSDYKGLINVWHPGLTWQGFDGSQQLSYLTSNCKPFFLEYEKIIHTTNLNDNRKNYCFKGQNVDQRLYINKEYIDWNDPYQVNKILIITENFLKFKELKKINRYDDFVDSTFYDIKEKKIKLTKEQELELLIKYNPVSSSEISEEDLDYKQADFFLQLIKTELILNKNNIINNFNKNNSIDNFNKNNIIENKEKFINISNILKIF